MSWSYDPAIPDSRDELRLLVGDTDSTNPLMQDEEMDYVLDQHAQDPDSSAADTCRFIAAKFAGLAARTASRVSVTYQNQYDNYMKLAKRFSARSGAPLAGGLGPTYLGSKDALSTTATNIGSQAYDPCRDLTFPHEMKE